MANGSVQVNPDSTGKKIDMSELTVAGTIVERERVVIADDSDPAALTKVQTTPVAGTEYGLVTRNIPGGTQPVSGPATDAQLRATPLPVSGNVGVTGSVAVTGPLTDAQLRANPVPISAASLPLPAGSSTEATLLLIKAKTDNLDVALSTRTKPADTQPISAASLPLPAGAATEATLLAESAKLPATLGQKAMAASLAVVVASDQSAVPVSAPVGTPAFTRLSDGAAALIGQKAMAASLPVVVASDQGAIPVSLASQPLPTGAATEATLALVAKDATLGVVGSTELGANTVLDRLAQIGRKLDTQIRMAAALQVPRPIARPTSTLLHRS